MTLGTRLVGTVLFGLAGSLALDGTALASGFGLREGDTDWMANAFVGDSAKAYDAGTAWSNPAGMTRLDRTELDVSANYIAPQIKFSGSNDNPLLGGDIGGPNRSNTITAAATGGVFGVVSLSPDLRLGIAATAPFGERISYGETSIERYQNIVSSVTDIAVALSVAYRVNDRLSIGGGPVIDFFSARITRAINLGPLAALGDPLADVNGSDTGVGFDLGALYQLDPATRLGLTYRSRITHNIDGTQRVSVPPGLAVFGGPTGAFYAAALAAQNSPAKTSITLPDSVSVGFYHDVDEKLALLAEVQWTDWSVFHALTVTPTNGAPGSTINTDYRNSWFVGVGANYRLSDALLLQSGVSYDQSPVTDGNRTPLVPDGDHYNIGVGAAYTVVSDVTLHLAYLHVFLPNGAVKFSSTPTAGTLAGTYEASDDSVSAGVSLAF